eukprot:Pgem_evm1s590
MVRSMLHSLLHHSGLPKQLGNVSLLGLITHAIAIVFGSSTEITDIDFEGFEPKSSGSVATPASELLWLVHLASATSAASPPTGASAATPAIIVEGDDDVLLKDDECNSLYPNNSSNIARTVYYAVSSLSYLICIPVS